MFQLTHVFCNPINAGAATFLLEVQRIGDWVVEYVSFLEHGLLFRTSGHMMC